MDDEGRKRYEVESDNGTTLYGPGNLDECLEFTDRQFDGASYDPTPSDDADRISVIVDKLVVAQIVTARD